MIQLIQNDKSKKGTFNVCLNESSYSLGWAYQTEEDSPYQYHITGFRNCSVLISQTLEDFEPFSIITFDNLFPWMKSGHSILISNERNSIEKLMKFKIVFYFAPKLAYWNDEFSFAEYCSEFIENLYQNSFTEYEVEFDEEPSLHIEFGVKHSQQQIKNLLLNFESDIKKSHEKTISLFSKKSNNIQTSFDFPEHMMVSCKQYLLYFVQFLKDLGVNATSTLKEEAGKILFSVTPKDEAQALDKIREALAVYLDLPNNPMNEIEYVEDFAMMRLQQQVRNLQHSQQMAKTELLSTQYALRLAQQTIENQDELLSHQKSLNDNQRKIIEKIMSKSIMMDSLENKEELEEICEGLKIGKSKFLKEQLGIDLNPATFLKGVGKKILGKHENTSIIETDEEK